MERSSAAFPILNGYGATTTNGTANGTDYHTSITDHDLDDDADTELYKFDSCN